MAQELGKIERPTAESFVGARKLFLVPLIYSPANPPADYVAPLERYWAGARNQLRRLAERTGPIRHIYHDGITQEGEAGRKLIETMSPRSHVLIQEFTRDDAATIEAFEDAETLYEATDWQRCLMGGLASRKVMDLAVNGYRDATKRRFELMVERIDQTLKPGENGIVLVPEEHRLQFPKDIQVFFVAPPALDEVHRWLRDQAERDRRQATQTPAEEPAAEAPSQASSADESSSQAE
jgi:hypothetical protein